MDLPVNEHLNDAYKAVWDRLDQIWTDEPPAEEAKALAATLAPQFVARIDELHQVMRALGLAAPDLRGQTPKLVEMTPKVIKLSAPDQGAGGKDVSLEIARNGRAFSAGRRYDANQARAELSDSEIARTGIYRLDLDRANDTVTVVFMTFDGKPSRIIAAAARALEPTLEGKTPETAVGVLRNRADGESLAEMARLAIDATERSGVAKGFFKLLFSGAARLARNDVKLLTAYRESGGAAANEADSWIKDPQGMNQTVAALVRRLDAAPELHHLRRSTAVAIAVGKALAALAKPAA